jgi:hypothetical protein
MSTSQEDPQVSSFLSMSPSLMVKKLAPHRLGLRGHDKMSRTFGLQHHFLLAPQSLRHNSSAMSRSVSDGEAVLLETSLLFPSNGGEARERHVYTRFELCSSWTWLLLITLDFAAPA